MKGFITAVELTAVTIETSEGDSFLVQLGPASFWAEQGVTLQEGDEVMITGFFEEDGSLSASQVSVLDTAETLALRDASGQPLWVGGSGKARSIQSGRQGQGQGGNSD